MSPRARRTRPDVVVPAADVRGRFAEVLRAAEQGHAVCVYRYGKLVAVIVAPEDVVLGDETTTLDQIVWERRGKR